MAMGSSRKLGTWIVRLASAGLSHCFPDQAALELGQRRKEMEDQLPAGDIVSMFSVTLWKPMPRASSPPGAARVPIMAARWRTDG